MFGLFRLIGIVVALGVAAIVVEPSWNGGTRSLTLRIRSAGECVEVVRALGDRVAGDRVADEDREKKRKRADRDRAGTVRAEPPPVAAGPVSLDEKPQEELTERERAKLDRLIEEKTREE